jgi:hypothetical protein
VTAEKEDRAASEKFLQVAKLIDDRRTIEILVLLAESYEHRANEWKARVNMFQEPEEQKHVELSNKNTSTATQPKSEKKDKVTFAAPSKQILSKEITASCTPRSRNDADIPFAEKQSNAAVVNTTENQLTQAAAEMEELWQRLNEIGLARNGSSDKVCKKGNCTMNKRK